MLPLPLLLLLLLCCTRPRRLAMRCVTRDKSGLVIVQPGRIRFAQAQLQPELSVVSCRVVSGFTSRATRTLGTIGKVSGMGGSSIDSSQVNRLGTVGAESGRQGGSKIQAYVRKGIKGPPRTDTFPLAHAASSMAVVKMEARGSEVESSNSSRVVDDGHSMASKFARRDSSRSNNDTTAAEVVLVRKYAADGIARHSDEIFLGPFWCTRR
ncbi:hypothetical protein LX32DRAFT_648694 [Colletotrichum zoysiae]|uniref:Secreted protein n=1 Tax=Colletotrichum zoysiae TaxID=1216348 RepID=A0AAD9HUP8_9PEZI|nr:hypothetical protein LX32DRAFT_648694 [Colletotrichum zoysiae]